MKQRLNLNLHKHVYFNEIFVIAPLLVLLQNGGCVTLPFCPSQYIKVDYNLLLTISKRLFESPQEKTKKQKGKKDVVTIKLNQANQAKVLIS